MKRYQAETQKKAGKFVPSDDPIIKPYPTINALCTDAFWDDGKPRTPCTIKFRFGSGQCHVYIADEDQKMGCMTTGDTSQEALQLLEDALAEGKITWRPWGGGKGRK